MTTTPLERAGRITAGPDAGQFVLVRDDRQRTGGFLIFQSPAPDIFSAAEVFDSWVERRDGVDEFFADAGWAVDWTPDAAVSSATATPAPATG